MSGDHGAVSGSMTTTGTVINFSTPANWARRVRHEIGHPTALEKSPLRRRSAEASAPFPAIYRQAKKFGCSALPITKLHSDQSIVWRPRGSTEYELPFIEYGCSRLVFRRFSLLSLLPSFLLQLPSSLPTDRHHGLTSRLALSSVGVASPDPAMADEQR